MTKGIVIAVFTAMLGITVHAQTNSTTPAKQQRTKSTPEQEAEREATKAQTDLGLTADQKTQFQGFALTRINNVRPLREKMRTTTDVEAKKKIHADIKSQHQAFDTSVKSILTADQLPKWEQHKKQMRERQKQNRNKKGDAIPGSDELDD
jgi:hypothetical protein